VRSRSVCPCDISVSPSQLRRSRASNNRVPLERPRWSKPGHSQPWPWRS